MGYFSDEYYPEDWKETGGSVEDNQIEEYAEAIYEDLRQEYKPWELQNMSMEEAMMSVDSYNDVPENLKEEVASYLMNMASQNEFFEEDMYNKGGVIENKMQSLENELNRLESELKWTQQQNGASKQYYLRKRRSGKMTRERAMELIDQSNASWKKEREKVREKIKEVKDRIKRLEELSSKVNADQFADGGEIKSIKKGDRIKDKYGYEAEVYYADGDKIEAQYKSGATYTYSQKDFDNGDVRFLWSDRELYAEGGGVDERIAIDFFTDGGIGEKYVINSKFVSTAFKKDMKQRLETNSTKTTRIIKLWSREMGINSSKYIDGEIIENTDFIEDSTNRAKHLFSIINNKMATGGGVDGDQ